MQPLHLFLHLAAQMLVQRRKRLVEQENGRLEDQRAGQRDALLLAARQLGRQLVLLAGEADALDHFGDAPATVSRGDFPDLAAGRRCSAPPSYAGTRRSPGTPCRTSALSALVSVMSTPSLSQTSARRPLEAGEDHQEGGLAGAGRTEQRQKLAAARCRATRPSAPGRRQRTCRCRSPGGRPLACSRHFALRFEHEQVSETQSSRQPKNHAGLRKFDSPHCSGFAHVCPAIMQDAAQPPSARA